MTSTRIRTRFLTGGLAAIAVASSMTLAGPAAADDGVARACGLPAVPATYTTVFVEAVVREVPPVTHEEWMWERVVEIYEQEFTKVIVPATTETTWSRPTFEHLWTRKVVDREAVAEVPESPEVGHYEVRAIEPGDTLGLVEYVQKQTGMTRWERDDWNGEKPDEDKGKGWVKTGIGEVWVVDVPRVPGTPAVTELSHTEERWATTSPGAGWTGPHADRANGTESTTTMGDATPAGNGWVAQGTTTVPAQTDTRWALTQPAGYDPTGRSRLSGQTTEQSNGHSAQAPAGDGWSRVDASAITVTDVEGYTETVTEGSSEQVELTPAIPASDPCVLVAGNATAPTGATAGPSTSDDDHQAIVAAAPMAASAAAAAPSAASTVLPATGSPVSAALTLGGLGALLAGGALVQVARRRQAS